MIVSFHSKRYIQELPVPERKGKCLIQIATLPGSWPSANGFQSVRVLAFDDIPSHSMSIPLIGSAGYAKPFTIDDATMIWEYVLGLPSDSSLLIHCEAGVSRSPAIAAAIIKSLTGDDREVFDRARPNLYVYGMMLAAHPRRHLLYTYPEIEST